MQLDHATIVTPDLETAVRFFTRVAGLTDGPRPPFGVPGHWLYNDQGPVLHLVQATLAGRDARTAPRIDHIAFRLDSVGAWSSLIERLDRDGIAYQIAHVPLTGERQLFVRLAANIVIEFVGAMAA